MSLLGYDIFNGMGGYTDVNPSVLEAGKVSRLPRTLGEAIKALESDKVLLEHLGAPLVTAICAIRKVGTL